MKYDDLCRTCLKKGHLVSLFKNSIVLNMLQKCVQIHYYETADLPNKICDTCLQSIIYSYKFYEQCHKIDKILKNNLAAKNMKFTRNAIKYKVNNVPKTTLLTSEKNLSGSDERIQEKDYFNGNSKMVESPDLDEEIDVCGLSEEIDVCGLDGKIDVCDLEMINSISCSKATYVTYKVDQRDLQDSGEDAENFRYLNILPNTSEEKIAEYSEMLTENSDHQDSLLGKIGISTNIGSKVLMNNNTKQPEEEHNYMCNMCPTTFPDLDLLETHIKSHDIDGIFLCNIYDKKFKSENEVINHQRTHNEKSYKRKKDFTQNVYFHDCGTSVEKPYKCNICGITFAQENILLAHQCTLNQHLNYKKHSHKCLTCGKEFLTKFHLNRHTYIHTRKNPFECPICGNEFTTKSNLKDHQRLHTGEKTYKCSICSKAFASNSKLQLHTLTHMDQKPHKCSNCEKSFLCKRKLNLHQRVHSEDKYKCLTCEKVFAYLGNLKRHQALHSVVYLGGADPPRTAHI